MPQPRAEKPTPTLALTPALLTLEEAAEAMRESVRTIERRIARGELPVIHKGQNRKRYVPASALTRWCEEHAEWRKR